MLVVRLEDGPTGCRDGATETGIEKQRRQALRDRDYVEALRNAAEFLRKRLRQAREELRDEVRW